MLNISQLPTRKYLSKSGKKKIPSFKKYLELNLKILLKPKFIWIVLGYIKREKTLKLAQIEKPPCSNLSLEQQYKCIM